MEHTKDQLIIDYSSELFQTNPWPLYTELREKEPIHWSDNHQCYFISKYKHLKEILLDTENFTVEHPFRATRHLFGGPSIIDTDGKAHTNIRPIISNQFKPSAIQKNLSHIVKRVVRKIIDEIPSNQPIDFMNEVALRIPMEIIMEVLGLPATDAIQLYDKMRPIMQQLDDPKSDFNSAISASDFVFTYVENAIRQDNSRGLIAEFMTAVESGRWSLEKLIRHVVLLLIAGSETTTRSIGNIMAILIEREEEMKLAMADHDYLKSAIHESLRWQPPLHSTARICKHDYHLENTMIPKGTFIILLYASANRDEEVYEHPELWDPTRKERSNLTFSMGSHNCLGTSLAKSELEETFEYLFSRFHKIELAQAEPPVIQGITFRSPQQLMLSFS